MAQNRSVTVITATKNLPISFFRPTQNRLSTSKAWKECLEEIEREFRYFRIKSPKDKKDALLIYGGREIVHLEKTLPDTCADGKLDEYQLLREKLNGYYILKKNIFYSRYVFLKMKPETGETTLSYATRLRLQAQSCEFGDACEERILEHLIQTTDNQTLIQKCIKKEWSLSKFLAEVRQFEEMSLQMSCMDHLTSMHRGARIKQMQYGRKLNFRQRYENSNETMMACSYCGLCGVHPKGQGCPAYRKRCYKCQKIDHFAIVCRTKRYQESLLYRPVMMRHKTKQNSDRERNSTEQDKSENLDKQTRWKRIGHCRIKGVKLAEESKHASHDIKSKTVYCKDFDPTNMTISTLKLEKTDTQKLKPRVKEVHKWKNKYLHLKKTVAIIQSKLKGICRWYTISGHAF